MVPKKASGRNVTEAERSTVRLVLRVPPDVADDLDELAERWGLTRSGTVGRLLEQRTTSVQPRAVEGFGGTGGIISEEALAARDRKPTE